MYDGLAGAVMFRLEIEPPARGFTALEEKSI
jgi:hypothetical protein